MEENWLNPRVVLIRPELETEPGQIEWDPPDPVRTYHLIDVQLSASVGAK